MHKWSTLTEHPLWLFTTDEFNKLPDGIVLESITGEFVTKGADYIDMDTRFGHIAYGVRDLETHAESELFSVFQLTK